jgi:hypothetical protein
MGQHWHLLHGIVVRLKWDKPCQDFSTVLGTQEALIKLIPRFCKMGSIIPTIKLSWGLGKNICRCWALSLAHVAVQQKYYLFSFHFHFKQWCIFLKTRAVFLLAQIFLRTQHIFFFFKLFAFLPLESDHYCTDVIMTSLYPVPCDFTHFFIFSTVMYS